MADDETFEDDELEEDDGPPDDLCGFCGVRRASPGCTACRTCGGEGS